MSATLLEEGIYQVEVCNSRLVVQVRMTMTAQYPSTSEEWLAHFLSGAPRFPQRVSQLLEWGARFRRIAD